jgi:CheY-like chemotaxis protein
VSDIAYNGLESLAALKARPYDVVLMDLHMPEMSGHEAAYELRTKAKHFPLNKRPQVSTGGFGCG